MDAIWSFWTWDPTGCALMVTCSNTLSTAIDLCNSVAIQVNHTIDLVWEVVTLYDVVTWAMSTTDKALYPPGQYLITITVSMVDNPSQFFESTIELNLVDLCDVPVSIDPLPD